jgi:sialate O-acetylesterase
MVLQSSPAAARIWGWTSTANEAVRIKFNGQTYTVTSSLDEFGNNLWSLDLPPTPASFQSYRIDVSSASGNNVTLSNILFGDVYVCSGQSNMQMTVSSTFNATAEIVQADQYPYIRLFTVGQNTISATALPNFATIEQRWQVASNLSVGGKPWTYFSSLCWFYGKQIHVKYGIPIGLVSSNWGGTYVQAWSATNVLQSCNVKRDHVAQNNGVDVTKFTKKASRGPNPNQPSVLYNAMIVPLLKMQIKGALWYQAESNVYPGGENLYACVFPAMIADWRARWNMATNPNFPFFFVQLAAYTQGLNDFTSLPAMRLKQEVATGLINVGMATAVDLGDLASDAGNIHPRDKETIATRMVHIADTMIYGSSSATWYKGPVPVSVQVLSDAPQLALLVTFDTQSDSLAFTTATCPTSIDTHNCNGFDLLTSTGDAVQPLKVIPSGTAGVTVQFSLQLGQAGVTLRYGFGNWPLITMYNSHGIPARPFAVALNN